MVCIQYRAMLRGSASRERKQELKTKKERKEGEKEGKTVTVAEKPRAVEKHKKASLGRKDRSTPRERW